MRQDIILLLIASLFICQIMASGNMNNNSNNSTNCTEVPHCAECVPSMNGTHGNHSNYTCTKCISPYVIGNMGDCILSCKTI